MKRFVCRCVAVMSLLIYWVTLAQEGSRDQMLRSEVALSPTSLVAARDGKILFIACATGQRLLCFDTASRNVTDSVAMPAAPLGVCLAKDGTLLFITCAGAESTVCIVDAATHKIIGTIPAGHTSMGPVLSADGKTLYVCNRCNHDVSVIDLASKKEIDRIPVQREPVAADITRDGKFLLVANHLPQGRADTGFTAAVVSVIDLAAREVIKELQLPNGSGSLQEIRVSPDGKYAVVTHVLGRFHRSLSNIRRGWININTMTIIDLARMEVYNTVLLDDLDSGAANPWGLAWTEDGARVIVAHAGTHEISLVDFGMVLEQLPNLAKTSTLAKQPDKATSLWARIEAADEIPFLRSSHPRLKLPAGDLGPRAVAVVGHTAYVANYFSDSLTVVDLGAPRAENKRAPLPGESRAGEGDTFPVDQPKVESIALGPKQEMSAVRKGEFYFHNARICLEGWQSCASCHPGGGRVDGLNWDLLNDGEGNPKNTKSLLLAHQTPPAMSLGVRQSAEAAVRAGIRHILFTEQHEEVASAIDAYLKSLKPVPSPYLEHGQLSKTAERGKQVFARAGCADCHPAPLFTDLHRYDVGTRGPLDKASDEFDTPSLVELWRTAPYLHDGSAVTVRDVVTTRNPRDQHGKTSNLTSNEIDELCTYLLSL